MQERTILVVEDNLEVREALGLLLESRGYAVLMARNGEAALEILDQKRPDLVLLDQILPRLTGWDVLKQIREVYPQLGVIMISGRTDSVDRVVGLELGADDYVTKPFDPAELLARVGAILRRTKRGAEIETDGKSEQAGSWDGVTSLPPRRRRTSGG